MGQSLMIKVKIDLTQPVASGGIVTIKVKKYQIHVKHEKMLRVYFKYGRIVHDKQECNLIDSRGD